MVLPREPLSGASEPRLNLVKHQQHVSLIAQLTNLSQVLAVPDVYASFSLDHFQQHSSARRVDCCFQSIEVIKWDVSETLGQRLECFVLFGLAGCMECGQSSSVERSQCADDYMLTPTAGFASKLDCSFKRFRSAVAKKDLATSTLKSVNRLCDFQTWHGFVQVRDVKKSSCLFGESLSYRWMRMAKGRHC